MSAAVSAQPAPGAATSARPASSSAAARGALASGEVLEIDKKEKRVLLKHGPIQHIGMDAMTMEFSVPDGKLLAAVKLGDKVRFDAAYKNGDYEITRMEVVKRRGSKPQKPRN
ncbi:MAG TPA: copper-binding protein [Ramlibacter sp.]|nr:copper-binding protein [Ramlibacter sp.]